METISNDLKIHIYELHTFSEKIPGIKDSHDKVCNNIINIIDEDFSYETSDNSGAWRVQLNAYMNSVIKPIIMHQKEIINSFVILACNLINQILLIENQRDSKISLTRMQEIINDIDSILTDINLKNTTLSGYVETLPDVSQNIPSTDSLKNHVDNAKNFVSTKKDLIEKLNNETTTDMQYIKTCWNDHKNALTEATKSIGTVDFTHLEGTTLSNVIDTINGQISGLSSMIETRVGDKEAQEAMINKTIEHTTKFEAAQEHKVAAEQANISSIGNAWEALAAGVVIAGCAITLEFAAVPGVVITSAIGLGWGVYKFLENTFEATKSSITYSREYKLWNENNTAS